MALVEQMVYLRMKKNINMSHAKHIRLKDIAWVSTVSDLQKELEETTVYRLIKKDQDTIVIDSYLVIDRLNHVFPNLAFQLIGPEQTIIRIGQQKKQPSVFLVSVAWIILFIGTAMTIMNFHYDVSMQEVQQKLHFIMTGKENDRPLWIQIPYSFGLGIGMLLFFNHWFEKRFNEEPSPLEIEMFNYQQDLDRYATHYENKLND